MEKLEELPEEEGRARECRVAPCSLTRALVSPMVCLVFGLVAMSYFPIVVWHRTSSALGVIHIAVFHVLVALLLASYCMTVVVDPGVPPERWLARQAELGNPSRLRVCQRSEMLKPPRSHYCSVTRRLVLNMDHFCPWVDNTVGFYNRKFFILFLLYSCVTCLYAAGAIACRRAPGRPPARAARAHTPPPLLARGPAAAAIYCNGLLGAPASSGRDSLGAATIRLMAMMVDVGLGISLLFFTGFHVGMAARNETTIESCGYADARYDVGYWQNLAQVFGRNRWLWLLPVYGEGPVGDGVHWQTRPRGTPCDEASHALSDYAHSDDSV